MMKVVMFFWNSILSAQRLVMFVTSICVLFLIASAAFMRYFLQKDFYGMEDIVLIMAFWMYFMGGAYASYEKSHISAEVVSAYVKNEQNKRILRLIASGVTAVLSWIFSYWGFLLVLWALESPKTTVMLHIPVIVPQTAIILGFFLMCLYSTIHFINDVRGFIRWKREGMQ